VPEYQRFRQRRLTASSAGSDDSRILRTMTRRKLLRVVEIAEILGVSKQRADQLRHEPDFPTPVDRLARRDLWAAADVPKVGADLHRRRSPVGPAEWRFALIYRQA
jgi:predicted DNA-binding transcriptional regulator AlpA